MIRIVLISIIVTALLVGGGVYWWQEISTENEKDILQQANEELQQQVNDLQGQVVQLQQANEELQQQVSDLQGQSVQLQQAAETSIPISSKPKPGWEEYFTVDTTTLMNKSLSEMRNLLGEPPVLARVASIEPDNSQEYGYIV
jgi:Tfp pilus assembly protein PilO